MLAFCAAPKASTKNIGMLQTNAIASWKNACPESDIFLYGKEKGAKKLARAFGATHIENISCSQDKTPLLNEIIHSTTNLGKHDILCFINCDILLPTNVESIVSVVKEKWNEFLIVGQCHNTDIEQPIDFSRKQEIVDRELEHFYEKGTERGIWGIDYFIFPKNLYENMPPFAIGRAGYDDWMVYRARTLGIPVINATSCLHAIHQNHDYTHIPGGLNTAYRGPEAERNYMLAGGFNNLYSIREATHVMNEYGELRRNLEGLLLSHIRRVQMAGSKTAAQ